MKKIFAIVLCLVMVLSLAACGGNSGNNGSNGSSGGNNGGIFGGATGAKLNDTHVNESKKMEVFLEEGETITPNGSLPNNEEDVQDIDVNYYFNEAINAIIQLDEEKMRLYLEEEECDNILRVKQDKDAYALWQHTVGNLTYLPSVNSWYGRPINIMYAMWYQDQIKNNTKLPEEVVQFSYQELVDIYNTYYDKVPVVMDSFSSYDEFYIEDGYIKFDIGSPMILIGVYQLDALMDENRIDDESGEVSYTNNLYELVLSWESNDSDWNDYEAIKEDGEYVLLDALLNRDLDAAEAIIDAADSPWEYDSHEEEYAKYVKNPDAKAALKKYIQESVQVYRTQDEVYLLFAIDTKVTFGSNDYTFQNSATEAERELVKSAIYYTMEDANSHEILGTQFNYTFGHIIDAAKQAGVFKDIDFHE